MLRAAMQCRTHPPHIAAKVDRKQPEEESGNLQPQNAAHAPEGTKKSAHAAPGCAPCHAGSPSHGCGCLRIDHSPPAGCICRARSRCSRGTCRPLVHHASGHAQPNAHQSAQFFRLGCHWPRFRLPSVFLQPLRSVYQRAALLPAHRSHCAVARAAVLLRNGFTPRFPQPPSGDQLLSACVRSKVEETWPGLPAHSLRVRVFPDHRKGDDHESTLAGSDPTTRRGHP